MVGAVSSDNGITHNYLYKHQVTYIRDIALQLCRFRAASLVDFEQKILSGEPSLAGYKPRATIAGVLACAHRGRDLEGRVCLEAMVVVRQACPDHDSRWPSHDGDRGTPKTSIEFTSFLHRCNESISNVS